MTEPSESTDKLALAIEEIPFSVNTLTAIAPTPAVPERYGGNVNDMFAAVMVGREMGIPPMMALNELYLVDGKVDMSGKLMSHLVHRRGHQLRIRITAKGTTVEAWRRDPWTHELELMGEFSFTDTDAKRAGLDKKAAWMNYPTMMRTWRAITFACRTVFADCLGPAGHTPEEHDVELQVGYTVEPIPVDEIEVLDDSTDDIVELENSVANVASIIEIESVGPMRTT